MLQKRAKIKSKKIEKIQKNIFFVLTYFVLFVNILLHCIPRLCNGSTSDSGSDCGGSSPPWGNKTRMTWILWSLRLSVRTKDSQSLKRGSIPLGTVKAWFSKPFFIPKF